MANIKSELLDLDREEGIIISKKDLNKMLQKLLHQKDPGKYGWQGYWMKAFKFLNNKLLNFLNFC